MVSLGWMIKARILKSVGRWEEEKNVAFFFTSRLVPTFINLYFSNRLFIFRSHNMDSLNYSVLFSAGMAAVYFTTTRKWNHTNARRRKKKTPPNPFAQQFNVRKIAFKLLDWKLIWEMRARTLSLSLSSHRSILIKLAISCVLEIIFSLSSFRRGRCRSVELLMAIP